MNHSRFYNTQVGILSKFSSEIDVSYCYYLNNSASTWASFIEAPETKVVANHNEIFIPDIIDANGIYVSFSPKAIISSNQINVQSKIRTSGSLDAGSSFLVIDELQIINNQFNSNFSIYDCGKTGIFDNIFDYPEDVNVKFYKTRKNLLCNNTFNNNINLLFKDGCAPTNLGTSHFNETIGGFITDNGSISGQIHMGNEWMNTSSATNLSLDNTSFYINPDPNTGNPLFRPSIILPNDDWFTDEDKPITTCITDLAYFKFKNDDDDHIFAGTYTGPADVVWYQKLETFEKLLLNPDIMVGNSQAQQFYNNCLGTDIEYVVKTKQNLQESNFEPILTPLLDSKMNQRKNKLLELHQLHNQLNLNYLESIVIAIQEKQLELQILTEEIIQLENQFEVYKLSKLSLATNYNDMIQGVANSFVTYQQLMNTLMISKLIDPHYVLNYADHQAVLYLAHLCPSIYGTSVFQARALLDYSEILAFGNLDPCSNAIKLGSKNDFENETISLNSTIVNNAIDLLGLNPMNSYHIEIISIDGLKKEFKTMYGEVDVSSLSSGIYFLSINDTNGKKHTKKFIKI